VLLSGRGLCDKLIIRPEESYRLWCVVVCNLENLKNEEAMTRVGSQRQSKKENNNTFIKILYMFRALRCASSGGLIITMQHLVLSPSVGDGPVRG
jgi:hypothetical protein